MALEINKLVGGYSQIPVLKDVSFDVQPGELVGLIGLNGAGKSTTLNHVIGLLRPFSGSIKINGLTIQANPEEYKKQIAYVPETPILYDELTLREHIDLTIMAYELDHDEAWQRATKLLKLFRLDNKLDWFPANFSKGMKQKVMIVTSFLANADLLVIDEPFTGLDPLAVANFIDLVKEAVADQKMVLMTTHVLAEAQEAVQTFAVLNNGTIETEGSLNEIRQFYGLKPSDSFDRLYQILNQETVKKHD